MEKSLDNKRKFISSNGDEYLNLSTPTVDISQIKVNGYVKVNQDCKGRLDRFVTTNISKDYNAIYIIMYANHIFNPFSIDEGDILYTPIYNDKLFSKSEEPILPDETTLSSKNKSNQTYAEKVDLLSKQSNGLK